MDVSQNAVDNVAAKRIEKSRTRKGFTLIELLVVIAILSILTAILMPVFSSARERARTTACLSNSKQIGLGLGMYIQDNDNALPAFSTFWVCNTNGTTGGVPPPGPKVCGSDQVSRYWDAALNPYVKSGNPAASDWSGVWHCPSGEEESNRRSYGMSMDLAFRSLTSVPGATPHYLFRKEAGLWAPAQTVFVGDGGRLGRLNRTTDYQGYKDKYITPLGRYDADAPWRHTEGANYIFCDGHAKWIKGDIIYPHPRPPSEAYNQTDGAAYCSRARYMSAYDDERRVNITLAGLNGYSCTP